MLKKVIACLILFYEIQAGITCSKSDLDIHKVLIDYVCQNDLEGARCLLKKGADARQMIDTLDQGSLPLVGFAQTVPVAEELLKFGAEESLQTYGPQVLTHIISRSRGNQEQSDTLLALFLSRGADPNQLAADGSLPFQMLCAKYPSAARAQLFMNAGARLDTRNKHKIEVEFNGYTFPHVLKVRMVSHVYCEERKKMREVVLAEQNKRVKVYCETCSSRVTSATPFMNDLSLIVANYARDQTYEELENEPLPKKEAQ